MKNVSPARLLLWTIVTAIGVFLLVSGIVGILAKA